MKYWRKSDRMGNQNLMRNKSQQQENHRKESKLDVNMNRKTDEEAGKP